MYSYYYIEFDNRYVIYFNELNKQEQVCAVGLNENIELIVEMLNEAYSRGFDNGLGIER